MSNHLKTKKKNKMLNQESSDEVPHKKRKKTKIVNEDENVQLDNDNNEVEQESYDMEEVPLKQSISTKINKVSVGVEEENWTQDDYKELIRRMEDQIPSKDNNSFSNRVEKLDWSQISFGSHSVEECYEKWKVLKSKVRHFRLLGEVLQDAKVWADTPWDTTRVNNKKKKRHPDQPQRPLTSFMLYFMEKKQKIIKKHPELKLVDISKVVGEKFNKLSESKKAYYTQKAADLQEEYKQNMKEFYEKHPELMPVRKKPKERKQKPLPPFKLFIKEKLRKHEHEEGFNKNDFTEKYKLVWKSLSLKKKASWVRLAKEEEDKYWKQIEDLNEEHTPDTHKSVLSKDDKTLLDRLAGKPEKPPGSAYSLFTKLMLQDKDNALAKVEAKSRMREVANLWKELPDERKRGYEEELKHMLENYKLEFANYLESLPEDKRAEELAKSQHKSKPRNPNRAKKNNPGSTGLLKEPVKPPITAWDLFKNEFVKKHSDLTVKEAYGQAAELWKNLPKKAVDKYTKKYELLKEKYLHDYEEFIKSLSEAELTEYSNRKIHMTDESAEKSSEEDDESSSDVGSESDSSEQSDSGVSEAEY